jgi:lipopolysaccharide transport system ATP-binding protein
MTPNVVIRAEGLGKKFVIGHQAERERYTTLRDSVGRSLKNWGRSARDMFAGKALVAGDETEEFWALKDINFEIKRGDVVGIIGRNGAGKSTLLKVLSRITEPTTGRVTIDGRVASLLEVGTGFHPELSGRENIYLNGAILGMSREEIKRKFDEIVDFAGVEKFLDTPVKRYSSGMYVRLAFAVAAHLEPEILIVDEVLAVGDAEFQKKCLGKMKDIAGDGRTVLFVSHNMAAVQSLCLHGIHMSAGTTNPIRDIDSVIGEYARSSEGATTWAKTGTADACMLELSRRPDGVIVVSGQSQHALRSNFNVGAVVSTSAGVEVFETGMRDHPSSQSLEGPSFALTFRLPTSDLRPGEYEVTAFAYLHNEAWLLDKKSGPRLKFEVLPAREAGTLYFGRPLGYGPIIRWMLDQDDLPSTRSPDAEPYLVEPARI